MEQKGRRNLWTRVVTKAIHLMPLGRRTLAKKLWWLAARPGWKIRATPMGHHMLLDLSIQFHREFFFGVYEQATTALFSEMLKPGSLFLDVGANCGYYSLLAAKRVGSEGKVIAYEPDPAIGPILQQNLELNAACNVEMRTRAISESAGRIRLATTRGAGNTHVCLPDMEDEPDRAAWEYHDVQTVALDEDCGELVETWEGDVFMKMDIEGAETFALRGAQTILDCLNAAIVEVSSGNLKRMGFGPEEIFRPFFERDFSAYAIRERDGRLTRLTEPVLVHGNVLFSRRT